MNAKMNRMVLIGGAAFLVLVAAVAIWFAFFSPPDKKDFTEARTKAEKIKLYSGIELFSEHYRKVITQSQAGDRGQVLVKSASAEQNKMFEALDNRAKLAEEISKSRVLRDEAVKKSYDTYRARETRYANYLRDYSNGFPLYRSSLSTCIDLFQVTRNSVNPSTTRAFTRKRPKTA